MSGLAPSRTACSGVVVTIVTPFRRDGQVDLSRLTDHTQVLVESGITAFMANSDAGEYSSLDAFERQRVASTVAEAAAGRAAVMVGVGGATSEAVELARHARDVGADAVVVHHPAHTYVDRTALGSYYERLLEAVDIGIVVSKRGPELTDELVSSLVALDNVIGVEYAVPDPVALGRLAAGSGDDVVWINGLGERWAPYFSLAGADGFSSGLANFAPHVALELHRTLAAGDYAAAMRLHGTVCDFEELRGVDHGAYNVSAVKNAMSFHGLGIETVREPLAPLSRERGRLVREAIRKLPGPDGPALTASSEAVGR